MLVEGAKRLQAVLASLQGNADADPEGLVETVREIEECLCELCGSEWTPGREWLSQRLEMLMLQVDLAATVGNGAKKRPKIPSSHRRRTRKA